MAIWLFFFLVNVTALAGEKSSPAAYNQAFEELYGMLSGVNKPDLKKAVFITENAYYNNQLDYEPFEVKLQLIAIRLQKVIRQNNFQQYKTAGNWAVFSYLCDTSALNGFRSYGYNFEDYFGEQDYAHTFVTKLLETRVGNCSSLPLLYKLLCNELGAEASLALCPNHLFIRHQDENGKWVNVELTNKSFPTDMWYIRQMRVSVTALESEIYFAPLSPQQEILLCISNLMQEYIEQFGYDRQLYDWLMRIRKLPEVQNFIQLRLVYSNVVANLAKAEAEKATPDYAWIKELQADYEQEQTVIENLGYVAETPEQYREWVNSVLRQAQDEKAKQTDKPLTWQH